MIDIASVVKKLDYLLTGHVLIMNHSVYGKYKVLMNPQQNRIIAEPACPRSMEFEKSCRFTSTDGYSLTASDSLLSRIETFIVHGLGDWTVEIEPEEVEVQKVITKAGRYEKI